MPTVSYRLVILLVTESRYSAGVERAPGVTLKSTDRFPTIVDSCGRLQLQRFSEISGLLVLLLWETSVVESGQCVAQV